MSFEIYESKDKKGKETIMNLMQLYTYELSFFEEDNCSFNLLDNGLYEMCKYTKLYWEEEKRHPYILRKYVLY